MYFRANDFEIAGQVAQAAEKRGVTGSQMALAWVLSKPYIDAPIIGATRMDHLEQAIAALDIHLDEAEIQHLEQAYQPHPVLGHS